MPSHFLGFPVRVGTLLCPTLDSDSDSDKDSCNMQDFPIGSDSDSDPLIEMYVKGTEICPWNGDLSLKWVQYPFGKGIRISTGVQVRAVETCSA